MGVEGGVINMKYFLEGSWGRLFYSTALILAGKKEVVVRNHPEVVVIESDVTCRTKKSHLCKRSREVQVSVGKGK